MKAKALHYKLIYRLTLLLVLASSPAKSQQSVQFWPEIDTYVKLDDRFRLFFNASNSREAGSAIGSEFGANLDIFLKPLHRLQRPTLFRLDRSQSRFLVFRIGYRYLPSPGQPLENRVVLEATSHHPLVAGAVISDRNRADLRWVGGVFSWRYRNRLAVERTVPIFSYHFTPYVHAETYYDSNYHKLNRTALDFGVVFPIRRRFEIEPYYEHMNHTGKSPNRQTDAVGLTLSVYFRPQL